MKGRSTEPGANVAEDEVSINDTDSEMNADDLALFSLTAFCM